MKLKEFILAGVVLVALISVPMFATHATLLIPQTPWLDEVHTAMLVNEPDATKFRAAVSNECVDANLPVYYVLLRTFHITSLSAIRSVSFAAGMLTLLGIYVLLRGSFEPIESAVGVLTAWATPMVVYQTFQARFYVPWFAAVIWFAVAMRWSKTARIRWLAAIAIAITSVLACTLHLLGLSAVGLIVIAEILVDTRPIKARVIAALPAAAGGVAVAMFIPLMIKQRHSFAIPTWVAGHPVRLFYTTLGAIIPPVGATTLLLGMLATLWICRQHNEKPRTISPQPLAGATSLLFFPLVLLVFTIFFQTVLVPRYVLICSVSVAAAGAYAATRMCKPVAIAVCLILLAESGAEMSRRVRDAVGDARNMDFLIGEIRADPSEMTLFESRHKLFPAVWLARDVVDQCAYVDFEAGPNQPDPVFQGFERDLAKKFERVFGWPKVMPWAKVMELDRFKLMGLDEDQPRVGRALRRLSRPSDRWKSLRAEAIAIRLQIRTSYSP